MTEPLKVGLVGTGAISRAHLPAYQEFPQQVELAAVCDIREDAARGFADAAGIADVYADMEAMLESADIDAVDICTIHDQHAHQVILAAQAGKHVMVEKPMGINVDECREMIKATDEAGVIFMVGQVFRYLPHSQGVRQLIEAGEIGNVWSVRSDDLHAMNPPASTLANTRPERAGHWYYDATRSGGGALITFTTHHLDLFRYYLGDIKTVSGKCWTDHPMFINGAEDRCWATLEFECGTVGNVWSSFTTRSPWLHRYWLYGEEGTICTVPDPATHGGIQHHAPAEVSSPGLAGMTRTLATATFVPVEPAKLPTDRAFVNEILHFAECCRTGREPLSSGRDNLGTMKAIFGIYESARTGRPVDLDDL